MKENKNILIKEIKKDVKQMAKRIFVGIYALYVYTDNVIVTCIDKSQWKLDCFFFANNEDVQIRLVSIDNDNDLEADDSLEDLTTESLSYIEKYLKRLKN